jgi:hypothetical protein
MASTPNEFRALIIGGGKQPILIHLIPEIKLMATDRLSGYADRANPEEGLFNHLQSTELR